MPNKFKNLDKHKYKFSFIKHESIIVHFRNILQKVLKIKY